MQENKENYQLRVNLASYYHLVMDVFINLCFPYSYTYAIKTCC